ncbi:hypothetical protein [Lactococcus formosensis]|uniref:Uncharacterized protein n=1 Tax=Lactococcus formosensis TaxID=1281486 RepID=A0A9Q9D625_9LACT|nr:hypothetical protein [Lactococcus formosensis]USJ19554.1 hypothetical protein LMK00_06875 [Lactococcus formosensis]
MSISKELFESLKAIDNLVELREWYHETSEFDDEINQLSREYGKNPITVLFYIVSGKIKVEVRDEEV